MTCRRELTVAAVFAAFSAQMQTTFGTAAKSRRELPPENVANVTDEVTGYLLELDGTEPATVANSTKVTSKRVPLLFLALLKCGEGEESALAPLAAEFEEAVETLFKTAITADGVAVHLHPSGAYGRAAGKGQMWVDVPAELIVRSKP